MLECRYTTDDLQNLRLNNGYDKVIKNSRYYVITKECDGTDDHYVVFRTKDELNKFLSKLEETKSLNSVIVVEGIELPIKKSYV